MKKVDELGFSTGVPDTIKSLLEDSVGTDILQHFKKFEGMPFPEFFQNTWAYGYDTPEYMDKWYIR